MSETTFFILFGVAWAAGMAYGLSAWRLLARVQRLKAEGLSGSQIEGPMLTRQLRDLCAASSVRDDV